VVLVIPPDKYLARLEQAGFRCIPLRMSPGGMNPFRELGVVIRIIRLYRRERPDLAHHFTIKCVLYGSLAAHLSRTGTVVNAVTGLGYIFTGGGLGKQFLQALVRSLYSILLRGTQVIFQNPDDRQAFIEQRLVQPSAAHLIEGSGVDMSIFPPQPFPDGTPLVVLAARMLWDKGIQEFVEAARSIKKQGTAARFALVGEPYPGNPAAITPEQLKAWSGEGCIEWWGWREDMPNVYAQARIVCLPSYREGLPRSLIEATACGRAVITTDVPGCRQLVEPGVNGLLVRVRDADSLAKGIESLLADIELCRRMGAAGHRIAEERFSTTRIIGETLAVYGKAGLKGLSL
jgi:glycosyltransferase involved in cell wall biosynthesis